MDMRYEMRGDGRRLPPRNARGEFRRRRSRRDRGIDYGYVGMKGGDYARNEMAYNDMRGDYRGNDMGDMARNDYGYDGHHGGMHGGRASGYEPVEFMGYCSGYYGSPEQDYGRNSRMDYNYDMRGRGRDYAYYDMARGMRGGRNRGRDYVYDYGYDYGDDYGDYGETLSEKELEHWKKKLMNELDDREKQMFSKEIISQKAKQMQLQMKGFGEKELEVATLMVYTDYKKTIGQNVDMAIRLAYDWLCDDDVSVKGAEKLAVYYDEIVEGGEE